MLCFTAAGRRLGPGLVNGLRLLLAVVLLGLTHRILNGVWLPEAVSGQIVLLALSGVVGLTIGDHALFVSFLDIGPRMSALIMTTSPIFAAFFGWIFLGEVLQGMAWLGVVISIAGLAWVVLERAPAAVGTRSPRFFRGVMCAMVGASCQAGGLMLSKKGMGHGWLPAAEHLNPQAATLVRMFFAGAVSLPLTVYYVRRSIRARPAGDACEASSGSLIRMGLVYTAFGSVSGPFLGVWLSLVASDRAPLGIAQTLCSLVPVLMLPVTAIAYKEPVTLRAVLGTLLAVGGAGLLFLQPG